ncbi:acetyl-CoA hydrolase/transferase family protein [Clostridium estertheticum]|uniref:acetyl-CoA hydrolase/transferase family protein n=1 Tax=Clostridium estertheticum TaxID=238834 RepID=UPI001CF31110|nr:acetyl-CoA hydrolase/transferase C-terminal domain-containing protein [Clostridium estertheticum]MCB2354028.1 4-hydroxybutyrate CoA-transferase [Clostridium estertheticum]WAG43162.1 4-hydroxybutyrate CoA-transferase [Clostridium estertheticum]
MNLKEIYKSKVITAEQAAAKVKSGDRVVTGHACGEPIEVIAAMIASKETYENVEIVHMVAMSKSEYAKPGMEKHFRHNSLFVGGNTRDAVSSGRADFTPCYFYEVPSLFKEELPVDIALIQVTVPDEHGYCSYGVSNDYTKPAAECAKLVIAEVNNKMPRTLGDCFIHISEIDYIVESNHKIVELMPPKIGDIEKAIGEHCASLVDDGSTLQLGIGAIPDAVLLFLKHKKNLGIHSEMISDGVVELVEAGVITGKSKTIHNGKIIVTFLMGTQRLYDFVNNNPMVEMYPVNYVNDPTIIMKNSKMISINSCVQVDLMGQVASESVGLKQISGVGGQVDFVRGANMCFDGKSIMAMSSTAAKGKNSKIVPFLDAGSAVTTGRNDVNYIITEYGIAKLKGKNLKDRARALINIAHPEFRPLLIQEWEKRFQAKF